ncbi:MAG: ATP synthase F1 subunit gamma [Patescibacteria group bacterium]|nr:ATP synthase F1 subunit gamma [Patescibacteria group bacterium]MDD5490440.1 ATP synthase F1 subunit gamma [Patescibacteria group bacterium]
MAQSGKEIKRRIKSVKNTKQITKAMEMVSAVKMRRSQEVALAARPYALKALEILTHLSGKIDRSEHPLLEERAEGETYLAVISTDKGLCGGLNANLFRRLAEFLKQQKEKVKIIAVGRKAREWAGRLSLDIIADFTGFGDKTDVIEVLPLARMLMRDYYDKKYGQAVFAYTNFISTLKQETVLRHVLPIKKEMLEAVVQEITPARGKYADAGKFTKEESGGEYIFEPSPDEVLKVILPKLIEIQVYSIILEANASEHSARMVAMKNASEAAKDMIEELSLSYNKFRQASITREIAEVSAGAAALEK